MHKRRTTISEQRAAGPSLLPLHKSQHDVYTTKLSLRCRPRSKYFATDSVCVCARALSFFFLSVLARFDTDGPSIMTFSEIGLASPKSKMHSTDVLACNYINRDTVSVRRASRSECRLLRFFWAYLWFWQLSWLFKHAARCRSLEGPR